MPDNVDYERLAALLANPNSWTDDDAAAPLWLRCSQNSMPPWTLGAAEPTQTLPDGHLMLEDPEVVIRGEGVLHLRFPVHRAATASWRIP